MARSMGGYLSPVNFKKVFRCKLSQIQARILYNIHKEPVIGLRSCYFGTDMCFSRSTECNYVRPTCPVVFTKFIDSDGVFMFPNTSSKQRRKTILGTTRYSTDANDKNKTEEQSSFRDIPMTKLDQTRQMFKETRDKMKEKMEEIIMRENIVTIPNLLCGARIVLSPILGYLVVQKSFECALGVFIFAGITDLLDGFIARNFKNQQSILGSFLDPIADKFLVFCLVLSLTSTQLLPVPLTVLIITRDVGLIGAAIYIRYLSLPPPKSLSRFFDITHATVQLSPTTISKLNTGIQLVLVACTLASPIFHLEHHPFLPVLWYVTATTTVASALSYVFSKNSYHLLKGIKDKK